MSGSRFRIGSPPLGAGPKARAAGFACEIAGPGRRSSSPRVRGDMRSRRRRAGITSPRLEPFGARGPWRLRAHRAREAGEPRRGEWLYQPGQGGRVSAAAQRRTQASDQRRALTRPGRPFGDQRRLPVRESRTHADRGDNAPGPGTCMAKAPRPTGAGHGPTGPPAPRASHCSLSRPGNGSEEIDWDSYHNDQKSGRAGTPWRVVPTWCARPCAPAIPGPLTPPRKAGSFNGNGRGGSVAIRRDSI